MAETIHESEEIGSTTAGQQVSRRCWICQQDDRDDSIDNNIWRSPCPCSLTAHDTCLLEWISNEEAPRPGEIARDRLIRCPQCRAEIKIQRSRDYIVVCFEAVQRMLRALVLPGAAASVLMCTYTGLLVYGINTIKVVFGSVEAVKLLQPQTHPNEKLWSVTRVIADIMKSYHPLVPTMPLLDTWKVFVGVPLIAPSLVILRTKWADRAFSFMLPWYFMHPANQQISWPPPPGLVFAILPYLKTIYDELYRCTFHKLEIKWDMAVQRRPRVGETEEQVALEAEREVADGVLEIRVALAEGEDFEIAEHEERMPLVPERIRHRQLQRLLHNLNRLENTQDLDNLLQVLERQNINILENTQASMRDLAQRNEGDQIRNEQQINQIPQVLNQQPDFINNDNQPLPIALRPGEPVDDRPPINGHNNDVHEHPHDRGNIPNDQQWTVVHHLPATQLVSLIIGSLAFPPVAAMIGDILKYTLPSSIFAPSITQFCGNKFFKRSILTERWGRTVVGGCLFVVLKDAFTLYCKWKKARDFGKRMIIDYTGERSYSS